MQEFWQRCGFKCIMYLARSPILLPLTSLSPQEFDPARTVLMSCYQLLEEEQRLPTIVYWIHCTHYWWSNYLLDNVFSLSFKVSFHFIDVFGLNKYCNKRTSGAYFHKCAAISVARTFTSVGRRSNTDLLKTQGYLGIPQTRPRESTHIAPNSRHLLKPWRCLAICMLEWGIWRTLRLLNIA